mgnify:CR=1 FL=1
MFVFITIIMLLSVVISGCVSRNSTVDTDYYSQNSDDSLNPVINAPRKAYFDTEIEFDASKSYDSNGAIVNYIWNFMDGKNVEGKTVKHTFEFDGNYDINFPLIYTVSLFVVDDDKNIKPCTHEIMLCPKNYLFYLSSKEMSSIKPMSHNEIIQSGSFFETGFTKKLAYSLKDATLVPSSNWNLSLKVEKPFFSAITKVSVGFYDENNTKLSEKEYRLMSNPFWKNKNVVLNGFLEEEVSLKSINIQLSGFNLNNIKVFYGSDKGSSINFNIENINNCL